jgi:hypothetical protein
MKMPMENRVEEVLIRLTLSDVLDIAALIDKEIMNQRNNNEDIKNIIPNMALWHKIVPDYLKLDE